MLPPAILWTICIASVVIFLACMAIAGVYVRLLVELGAKHTGRIRALWIFTALLMVLSGVSQLLILQVILEGEWLWAAVSRVLTAIVTSIAAVHLHLCVPLIAEYSSPSEVERRCYEAGQLAAEEATTRLMGG